MIIFIFSSCKENAEKHTNKKTAQPLNKNIVTQNVDENYTIERRDILGDIKLSFDIRLKNKVSEEQLKQFALTLKGREHKPYERIFIFWYLQGMEIGAGAWATTHFNPNLEVRILGVTIEEEKGLTVSDENRKGFVLGKWFDDSIGGGKYTLMNNNGTITMYIDFMDKSIHEEEMIESFQLDMLRYDDKNGNDFGEYYLIDKNRGLSIYGKSGLIRTLHAIQ
jgi:hypothetical protein